MHFSLFRELSKRNLVICCVLVAVIIAALGPVFYSLIGQTYQSFRGWYSAPPALVVRIFPSAAQREKALALIPSSASAITPPTHSARSKASFFADAPISDPLLLVRSTMSRDSDLITWMQHRFELLSTDAPAPDENEKLASILQNTPLSYADLFMLSNAFQAIDPDSVVPTLVCERAMAAAHKELSRFHFSISSYGPVLHAIQKSKPILWNAVGNGNHDHILVDSLCAADKDCITYVLPGDRGLELQRQDSYVGIVECLDIEGKFPEAIEFAKSVNTAGWKRDAITVFAWAYGNALDGNRQYAAAIPKMEAVLMDRTFANPQEARRKLMRLYSMTGQQAKALRLSNEYVAAAGGLQ